MRGWIVAGAAAVVGLLGVAGLMLVAPATGEADPAPSVVSSTGQATPLGERMAAVARAEQELAAAEARAAAAAEALPPVTGSGSVAATPGVEDVAGAVGQVIDDAWGDDDDDHYDDDRYERDDDDHYDDDHGEWEDD